MTERPGDGLPIPVWGNGGGEIVAWAKVDRQDWLKLRRNRYWFSDGYVFCNVYMDGKKTTMPIHRQIMGLENGDPLEVDHIDRDRLNNRRSNLRVVTRWGNEGNHDWDAEPSTSKKIGVSFDSRLGKWKAQGSLDGRYVYLGVYGTEEEAIYARCRWERENDRIRHDEMERLGYGEERVSERDAAGP